MKAIKLIGAASLFMMTASCEKVIEIDIEDAEQRIVVEGYISQEGTEVKLTRTSNFFEANRFPLVTDAQVTIRDDQGTESLLNPGIDGIYRSNLTGIPGRKYTLNIKDGDHIFEAQTEMPLPPIFDSLFYSFQPANIFSDSGFVVTLLQTDPPGQRNYYMLRQIVNDTLEINSNDLVYEDEFFDGTSFAFTFFELREPGDTVVVEMISLDEKGFTFFSTLNETKANNDGSPFAGTPQNPITNVSNNGLGFFGARNIVRDTVIIQ